MSTTTSVGPHVTRNWAELAGVSVDWLVERYNWRYFGAIGCHRVCNFEFLVCLFLYLYLFFVFVLVSVCLWIVFRSESVQSGLENCRRLGFLILDSLCKRSLVVELARVWRVCHVYYYHCRSCSPARGWWRGFPSKGRAKWRHSDSRRLTTAAAGGKCFKSSSRICFGKGHDEHTWSFDVCTTVVSSPVL